MFRNKGDGSFEDITRKAKLDRKASAVGAVFADTLNRGKLDLYVTTDSWLSGANYTEPQLKEQGHTVEPNGLYLNDGHGVFQPDPAKPLAHKALSHDAILEDLDHDGKIDIYVGVDAIPSGNRFATHKGGNPLWTRNKENKWRETAADWGIKHESNCVCVPSVDFDGDGDLDLLLVNFYNNVVLYRNNTNDKNWLIIKPVSNGIGARVYLYALTGEKKQLLAFRHIQSGAGYCRSSPLEAHFGIPPLKASTTLQVEVLFPGIPKPLVLKNTQPGQRIEVKPAP